ncbi:MAG TPA: DUF4412 domain-containing protein [Planctomycetota bacterium]
MSKLAPLAALLLAVPALAQDLVVTRQKHSDAMKMPGHEVPASDTTEVTWIGKDRMRSDEGNEVTIVRLDLKKLYQIDMVAKTYTAIDLPFDMAKYVPAEIAPMLEQMKPKVTLTPTTETKQIKDWTATKYTLEISMGMGGGGKQEMWVAKDVGVDLASYREMAAAMLAANPMMGGMAEEMKKVDGFAVLTERTMMGSKSTEAVVSIEKKEAPAGHYDLPAGLTEKPFDPMEGMGGGGGPRARGGRGPR